MSGARRGVAWREIAAVAALLLLLGVAFTWPLARHGATDVLYTHEAAPGYERVPLAHGDHLQVLYYLWLFGDSVHEGRSLLEDPYQFRAGGPPGFFFQPSLLPILTFLLAPLGLVGAFNALTVLSFLAAGLSTYLLLRLEFEDRLAALAGALVVALFPQRVAQLAGHVNGHLSFLVPLWLYLFERSLRARRWAGWAVAAGAAHFFACAMEFHLAYYFTLFLGLWIPFRFLFPAGEWLAPRGGGPAPSHPGPLPHLVAALGGLGAGVAAYHAADRAHGFAGGAGWVVTPLAFAGAAWLLWRGLRAAGDAYLAPPPAGFARAAALPFAPLLLLALAPLGSRLAIPRFGAGTALVALAGAAALALPLLRRAGTARLREGGRALLVARARRFAPQLAFVGATLAFLVVVRKQVFSGSVAGGGRRIADVLLFSPGPADLLSPVSASGERLVYLGWFALLLAAAGAVALARVADPRRRLAGLFLGGTFLGGAFLAVGAHLEALPLYHLLFRTLPLFNFPRVTGRIFMVAVVGLAVLVAAGAAALRSRAPGRRGTLLAGLALLLLALDYAPRRIPGLTTLPASHPVYERLAAERAPGEPVLELPIWPGDTAWTSIYLWYVTRSPRPLVNGYSPATPRDYPGRVFAPLYPLDFGEMGRPQYDLLRGLGVRHVVFHEEAYPPKVSDFPFRHAVDNLRASPLLETVAYEPPLWLFRLRETPPAVPAPPARTSPVGSLWEGERLIVAPGAREEDALASGGAVARWPAGSAGIVNRVFPRRTYPSGIYRARVRLVGGGGAAAPGVKVEVKHAESGLLLAAARGTPAAAAGEGTDLDALFALEAPTPVFVEISSDGTGPLRWDFLLLTFAGEPEPRLAFELEELWHMGRPLADPDASGEEAIRLVPGYHPRDFAFSGPDRILPAGRWTAELRYRAGPGAPAPEERLEVAIANAAAPLAAAALPAAGGGGYETLRLPFRLGRAAPVRVRVFFPGRRELVLDRIEFAPG